MPSGNPLLTALKKKTWKYTGNKLADRPDGTKLMHGTHARLRPGERLHPSDQGGNQEKGVYATGSKRVARTTATYTAPKGYVYSFPKKKAHKWHTTTQVHPNMAYLENPHRHPGLEVNSAHHIKPTHVTEAHFDIATHWKEEETRYESHPIRPDPMRMTAGLFHYHGKALSQGHTYRHEGRKVPGVRKPRTSTIAHNNLPAHTSAQGQTRMPIGTSIHSAKGRGARRHQMV